MGFVKRIGRTVFAALISLTIVTPCAAEKEPLENHVATFNEMDAMLRSGGSANATNHITWVETAIKAKRDLRLRKEIVPWLNELSTSCSNDWRVLRAVTTSHMRTERYYYDSLTGHQQALLMDRAYHLARENASPEELSRLIDDYITCLFSDDSSQISLSMKTTEIIDSEINDTYRQLRERQQNGFITPPVFHLIPTSFEAAKNDGEIIRWLLANKPTSGYAPLKGSRDWDMPGFAAAFAGAHHKVPESRFDNTDSEIDELWRNKLHTVLSNLEDHQTVVWSTENGFQNLIVDLPEDYRFINAYKARAESGDPKAAAILGNIYVNRSQLERAIEWYTRAGDAYTNEVRAIQSNQGRLTRRLPQCAGTSQSINYIFRNGSSVDCSIHPINQGADLLPRLIAGDVIGSEMKLLEGDPKYFHKFNIAEQEGVLGAAITNWSVTLPPVPHHLDASHAIEVPALDTGFYLLRANMRDGNTSETVLHIYDTLLLSTDLENSEEGDELFILCDAHTGEPRTNEPLHFIDATDGIKRVDRETRFGYSEEDEVVTLREYILKKTDRNGLLTVDRRATEHDKKNYLDRGQMGIIAFADRAHPFLPIHNTTKLSAYDHTYRGEEETGGPKFFVTTDRPVYRPGDTGHLKFWTPGGEAMIAQDLVMEHTKHLDRLDLIPTASTNEYDEVLLDDFCGTEFQFTIPKHASLGTYAIKRKRDSSYNRQHSTIRVEEYRAPELLLNAAFTDDGKIELRATHAYGEPLASGTLQGHAYFCSTPANPFHPPAPLDPAWGPGYWWNGGQFSTDEDYSVEYINCSAKFDLELNQAGIAYIDIPTVTNGPTAIAATGYFSIQATLTDSKGKKEEQYAEAATPPTVPPKLCCWLDRAFFAANDPIACHFASGPHLVPARVEIRDRFSEALAQSINVDQNSSVNLEPLTRGNYEARLISRDGKTSRPFQFAVGAPQAADLTAERPVQLVVEKGVYKLGDTARILIQVDQPGRYVYLFPDVSDQFGFDEPQIIEMKQASQVAEIKVAGLGVLRCAAMTVVDGKAFLSHQFIRVETPELDAGKLELTPDKKRYTRGEEVALAIKTTAGDGTPRPCSVTVTVYNSALDLWAPARKPSIIATLFAVLRDVRREKVNVYNAFNRDLPAITPFWAMRWIAPKGELPFLSFLEHRILGEVTRFGSAMTVGEDPAFNESDPPSNLKIREDFRDLAYWNASVLTDSNGCATVNFPMPDGLMKWKIKAWATHTNYAATATTSIECAQDFVANLQVPRFIREGDELTLTTTIRNHTNCVLERVATSIEAEGLELVSPATARIKVLHPDVEANVYWDLTAPAPGIAEITTKAWSPIAADGMKKTIPILPRGMLKRGGRGGVLAGYVTSETITIEIPTEIDPATLDCQLNISPHLLDALANALPFLEEYPHDCAEQTLNKFLSSLIIMRTIEELGGTVTNRTEILERASKGFYKLINVEDEGWGWNLDYDSPRDPFISAWIARGLRIFDTDMLLEENWIAERLLGKFDTHLAALYEATNSPCLFNVNALQALIVSEFNLTDIDWEKEEAKVPLEEKQRILTDYSKLLLTHADQLSLYGKVLLALAFEHQGDAANRDKLIAYIDQFLEHDTETGAAWLRTGSDEYWHWYNDDIETHAWYLKLMNRADPHGERAAGVARHLMLDRVHGDHWKSTRDTAICIEALAEFAKNNQPKPGEAKPVITLNGARVEDPAAISLSPGSNTLTISSPSGAPLFHDVTWEYYSRENPITAETCELVTIERKYFRAAKNKENRIEVLPGETVAIGEQIEVELSIHANRELEYLFAEDFKPAGFETIDQTSGYADGAYRELHDERVSYYLHRVRKGATRLTYEMRGEFEGTLSAHPATIELMYAPRQAANTEEREFLIKR